jgi:hypothetical protein
LVDTCAADLATGDVEVDTDWTPRKLAGYVYNNLNGLMILLSFGADKKTCRDIASICLSVLDGPGR